MAKTNWPRRMVVQGLFGAGVGYAILHPISMLIHDNFENIGCCLFELLAQSFTLPHLKMGVYFALLGLLTGLAHGIYLQKLALLHQKMRVMALADELTSLCNRRSILNTLQWELDRAKRYDRSLCLLMLDLDHFKEFNDTFGHLAGDGLLKAFSALVQGMVRDTDIVGRYGGDEFMIVMPETNRMTAHIAAERLCHAVEEVSFQEHLGGSSNKITVSIGIAEFPTDATEVSALMQKADVALYQSKENGRNRVCMVQQTQNQQG